MVYIILAAGAGTRLNPITLTHPKTLFSLDSSTTILGRMTSLIRLFDPGAKIIVVIGFHAEMIRRAISEAVWVYNPFYSVTNSIASLWFARKFLNQEVTIINGDIVMSQALMKDVITRHTDVPYILMDSSINNGDYNVQVCHDRVVVMSKALARYSGEYAGVTKLDAESTINLKRKIEEMVENGLYNTWYEDALVQMIFENNFELYAKDISSYTWTEVDCVDDLMYARTIHEMH